MFLAYGVFSFPNNSASAFLGAFNGRFTRVNQDFSVFHVLQTAASRQCENFARNQAVLNPDNIAKTRAFGNLEIHGDVKIGSEATEKGCDRVIRA